MRLAVDAAHRCGAVCRGEAPAAALLGLRRDALAAALAARAALRAGAPCSRRAMQPHPLAHDAAAAMAAMAALGPAPDGPAATDGQHDAVSAAAAPALAFALLRAGAARAHPGFEFEELRGGAAAAPGFVAREGLACLRVLALAGWTHAAPAALLRRLRRRGGPLLDELAPAAAQHSRAPPPLALRGAAGAVRRALAPPPRAAAADAAAAAADADAAAEEVLCGLEALCGAARAAFLLAPPRADVAVLEVDAAALDAAMRRGGDGGPRAARGARFRALCCAARVLRAPSGVAATVVLPAAS